MAPLFWNKWKAKREGKKDGKLGIPTGDSLAQYEKGLVDKAEWSIRHLTDKYEQADKKSKENYCEEVVALDNLNERIEDLKIELNRAGNEHQEQKTPVVTRPPVPVPFSYWLIFSFLAICEFPMNSVVFDLLGEAKWLTYLLAAGLGVMIPLAAHFLGIQLRKESPFESFRGACKAMLIVLIMLAVLISIAYMRERYVAASNIVKILGIEMDPRMVTMVFLSINALIFMVATIASQHYHIDVGDEIKRSQHALKVSKRLLDEKNRNLDELIITRNEVEESLSRLRTTREKLFNQYKARAENISKVMEWLITVYRRENLRMSIKAGSRKEEPVSFTHDLTMNLGIFAGELDEDCGEEAPHEA